MRSMAWLSLVLAVGLGAFASGYYIGFGKGAETLGTLTAQNSVSDSIGEIRVALAALDRNDLEFSRTQHENAVRTALLNIGAHASVGGLPTWDCKPAHRATMDDARLYLKLHPPAADDRVGQMMLQAAEHCR
jgi:hypothetical protein